MAEASPVMSMGCALGLTSKAGPSSAGRISILEHRGACSKEEVAGR